MQDKNFTSIEPENQRFLGGISGGLHKIVEERLPVFVIEVDVAGILLEKRTQRLPGQQGDPVRLLGSLAGGEGLPREHGQDDRDGEAQRNGVRRRHRRRVFRWKEVVPACISSSGFIDGADFPEAKFWALQLVSVPRTHQRFWPVDCRDVFANNRSVLSFSFDEQMMTCSSDFCLLI
jgi:hypothetical protein